MKFKVHMLAFCKTGTIRIVDVPQNKIESAENDIPSYLKEKTVLELIFYYGQNDFQPQRIPSVSVGDVVEMGNEDNPRYFEVNMSGFKEITPDKFKGLEGERSLRGDIFHG